jgi:DNA invertase Pin-like site-specific DNA recombinase
VKVGYARVSTDKREQDISIESQVRQLENAGCDRVIAERKSAYKGQRKGWNELWELVASGVVTEVLTVDQSRLSRSGDDLDFLNACSLKGVQVRGLIGGVMDPNSYQGFVITGMMSVMNRAYSKLIAAKTRDGLSRRRAAGYYASGKLPFGYVLVDGCPAPHPQHFEEARVMWLQLMEREMNVAGWIKDTGMPWTPRGVRKWFANPMLRGAVRGQWGQVDPVIEWEEWEQAQSMLKVRSVMRGSAAHCVHLFTGLVKCEACGKSLHNVRDRVVARLKCKSRHCSRYGRGIAVEEVKRRALQALQERADAMAAIADVSNWEDPVVAELQDEITRLEATGLAAVQSLIDERRQQLNARLSRRSSSRLDELRAVFADPAALAAASDRQLRPVLLEFIERIVWLGGVDGDSALSVTLR